MYTLLPFVRFPGALTSLKTERSMTDNMVDAILCLIKEIKLLQ